MRQQITDHIPALEAAQRPERLVLDPRVVGSRSLDEQRHVVGRRRALLLGIQDGDALRKAGDEEELRVDTILNGGRLRPRTGDLAVRIDEGDDQQRPEPSKQDLPPA
jgi:hypothetical protein